PPGAMGCSPCVPRDRGGIFVRRSFLPAPRPLTPGDATERTMHTHARISAPFALRLVPAILTWLLTAAFLPAAALRVEPAKVVLDSPEATQQLLVTGGDPAAPVDWTRSASYKVLNAEVAAVDPTGLVLPKAEGRTEIVVGHKGEEARVAVEVTGLRR